jgi:hypothetical protein
MKHVSGTLGWALGCAFVGLTSPPNAYAVAPRAYVSVNGNDANTCSAPATPCRTFTGAIAQTSPGGEVVVLDSGTFGGGTISQAVTINAPAGVVALVATPISVNAGASDVVTLRGISFVSPTPGTGVALNLVNGKALHVERCAFHGWSTGINLSLVGRLSVTDTTVRENTFGISLYSATGVVRAAIQRTDLLNNSTGLFVDVGARATIADSLVAGNAIGIEAHALESGTSLIGIENCTVSNNTTVGMRANTFGVGFSAVRFANSTITDNNVGVWQAAVGASVSSRGDSTIEGNTTNTIGTIGTYVKK